MPKWTDEQLDAINSSGKNIIVSAGAGSGKTAVLTERVIKKLKSGVKLNELLVLTFTNAAASEMKERIRKAITKDTSLIKSLDYIDSAYITTFDSYALSIVKKYHYLLNISNNIKIVESSILVNKKNEILEHIFENEYKNRNNDFVKLISDFCLKNDSDIISNILSINQKLDLIYDKNNYLNNYINKNFSENKINNDIQDYVNIIKNEINDLKELVYELSLVDETDYHYKLKEQLEEIFNGTNYQDYRNIINIEFPKSMNLNDEARIYRDRINEKKKYLITLVEYESTNQISSSIKSTKPYVQAIIRIIKEFDLKINEYKASFDAYEFQDIAKLAIKLVSEYKEVRDEIKNSLHEILVDEYQDTSDLQELFISNISNNNVYMVGDIKQSIYRFRNANPDIFKHKYDLYKNNNGGKKIDLNKNFRSRNTVIDNINNIFDKIMDNKIGGANYKLEHRLIFGNNSYIENGTSTQNMDMEIFNYQISSDSEYKKEEVEAHILANDIKNKIENKFQIFDKDIGILRDIKYSDFAILPEQKKYFDLYKKIFTYYNIPLLVNKEGTLTDSEIIWVIKNIFILLTNEKQDQRFYHSYMSVGRSFLFGFSDQQLFNRVISKDLKDDLLYEIIKDIRKEIPYSSIRGILNIIIEKFNIYEKLINIGDINENIAKLDYLNSLTESISDLDYDIYSFTLELENIINNGISIQYNNTEVSNDAVRIMTIHKSKGLEFPICYFTGLDQKFILSDLKDKLTFDNLYGFITPYYDNGIKRTIYTELVKGNYYKETISEKLRLFYVALTRAKEKVIFITDLNLESTSNSCEIVEDNIRLNYRSLRDILYSLKKELNPYIINIEYNKIPLSRDYNISKKINFNIHKTGNDVFDIKEFKYDTKEVNKEYFSHPSFNIKNYEEMLILKTGNYFHEVLENIDFNNINLENSTLTDIEKKTIETFLNQDIVKDIKKAKIYQEYRFVDIIDDVEYHGIIDLLLEYDDHIVIIDYKLKNINNNNYNEQLKGYKKIIEHKTNKPVKIYLYSILNGEYKEVI